MAERARPTLEEIRTWPATVDVTACADALGVSRAHAYDLARRGELPVRVLMVGGRIVVVTASIVALLDDQRSATGPDAA